VRENITNQDSVERVQNAPGIDAPGILGTGLKYCLPACAAEAHENEIEVAITHADAVASDPGMPAEYFYPRRGFFAAVDSRTTSVGASRISRGVSIFFATRSSASSAAASPSWLVD